MNRIEKVREYVDDVLLNISDTAKKRFGYLHLYGVSQNCAMIAMILLVLQGLFGEFLII